MTKNLIKNFLVLCLVGGIGIAGTLSAGCKAAKMQHSPKTRALSLTTSIFAVKEVLQNVAKAIVNLGPLLSSAGSITNPATALNILAQVMQVAADVQKQEEVACVVACEEKKGPSVYQTRSKKQCGCPCVCAGKKTEKTRSFHMDECPMDAIMGLVIKTAQLPGVTEKSSLWMLKSGVVRTPPQVLFQQMMEHSKSRKKLLRDFFTTLRIRVIEELEKEGPVATRTAWTQAMFPVGAMLLIPLVSFLIDMIQKIMNKYVDDVQVGMTAQGGIPTGAGQEIQLSPAVLNEINNVIDSVQGLANIAIDGQQGELVKNLEQKQAAQE